MKTTLTTSLPLNGDQNMEKTCYNYEDEDDYPKNIGSEDEDEDLIQSVYDDLVSVETSC